MSDRSEFEGLELPPELKELDAELSSIRYEERPSFGPELRAELARTWPEVKNRRHWPVRQLLAASIAGLCMVGLGVPSARGALIRFVNGVIVGSGQQEAPAPAAVPDVPLLPFDQPTANEPVPYTAPPRLPAEPPADSPSRRSYNGPEATFPELLDRLGTEDLIRANYPIDLQRSGVGGTVRLLLWVDSAGGVDVANVANSSGVPALDQAALQVAPSFHFTPARRRGKAVGTWVEFDVRFEPLTGDVESFQVPEPGPAVTPSHPPLRTPGIQPDWRDALAPPAPGDGSAGAYLERALRGDAGVSRLGSLDAILQGDPPVGAAPTQWRSSVAEALQGAIARSPDNPAPFLALARIRRKQGLRTEARVLFERGLQRAQKLEGSVSPALLADLYYERGALFRESWLGARGAGRLPAGALPTRACPQARSSGGTSTGYASVDRLIAWNFLCPEALGQAFETSFEPGSGNAEADRTVMMASFRSAVEADPAHVRANVQLLLELADEGAWDQVLRQARRFTRASQGDPHGLLLEGLALQRMSRTEEAEDQFRLAFKELPAEELGELMDVSKLLDPAQSAQYWKVSGTSRESWVRAFWERLDPILSTRVNEREVEHYARAAYAHLRFGSALSDPGEIWVRYGRPSEIRVLGDGGDVRTEFWDYGSGPDITFRRMASSESLDLTSEGRAYADELRQIFPHRYGTGSRLVFALPGQVARFRGPGAGASDVNVYTQVPALPATAPQDTLDLNVFLLGAEGEKLDMVQRFIAAKPAPISLEAPAAPEVASVVVEIFNRRTGQAAALRDTVHAAESVTGATVSDLLLTRPASPSLSAVKRDASWMEPLTLSAPVDTHEVGAFFELYDVASMAPWYSLSAEMENLDTGETVSVPIRPAGESGLRATWDRRPAAEGPTREFLGIWLGDVKPGRYDLRVLVDLPDADAPLVAERELDRR